MKLSISIYNSTDDVILLGKHDKKLVVRIIEECLA